MPTVAALKKFFRTATPLSAVFLIGWGFSAGGILGSLTGLVGAIGIGSALSIAIAGDELDAGLSRKTLMQRIGGFITAVACAVGVHYGGWRVGWLYGLGGYVVGTISMLILSFLFARDAGWSEKT